MSICATKFCKRDALELKCDLSAKFDYYSYTFLEKWTMGKIYCDRKLHFLIKKYVIDHHFCCMKNIWFSLGFFRTCGYFKQGSYFAVARKNKLLKVVQIVSFYHSLTDSRRTSLIITKIVSAIHLNTSIIPNTIIPFS